MKKQSTVLKLTEAYSNRKVEEPCYFRLSSKYNPFFITLLSKNFFEGGGVLDRSKCSHLTTILLKWFEI